MSDKSKSNPSEAKQVYQWRTLKPVDWLKVFYRGKVIIWVRKKTRDTVLVTKDNTSLRETGDSYLVTFYDISL